MIPIALSALLNFNTNPVALKLVEYVDSLSSLNASHEILSNFPQLLEACQIFFFLRLNKDEAHQQTRVGERGLGRRPMQALKCAYVPIINTLHNVTVQREQIVRYSILPYS